MASSGSQLQANVNYIITGPVRASDFASQDARGESSGKPVKPRPTNQRPRPRMAALKDHDFDLLREVVMLTNDGLSERRAIKRLAADRKKRQLFPYREQQHRHFAKGTEQKRREEALWARLQKLKASANARSILNLIVGDRDDRLSFYERTVRDLDESNARSELVKNQQHRRNSGS